MWLLRMLLVAFLSSCAVQGGAKQRNPYTVLELKKEATHAEVKKAYRKAALKYHQTALAQSQPKKNALQSLLKCKLKCDHDEER